MSDAAPLNETATAREFELLRPYLLRVAYSHLGTIGEAEDVVQEAWLRLDRADRSEIRDLRAWLTTTVARLSLDTLKSARARREQYIGTWLPEPLVAEQIDPHDPADRITLDESVSMALLVVLESLSPAERSAFLLHDVFGYSFEEVGAIVGRSPAATRQLAARARRQVEHGRPRYPASPEQQREVVDAFVAAANRGDIESLLGLLDPDVEMRSDGGGVVTAARQVLHGAGRVGRVVAAMAGHYAGKFETAPIYVNGAPGLRIDTDQGSSVVSFTVDGGRIRAINVIRNPEKLRGIAS